MSAPALIDRLDHSPASFLALRLVRSLGAERAHEAIDAALSKFSVVELAALELWWEFWAGSKQLAPHGDWVSWGFLTGRGKGKTKSISKYINEEAEAGRAMLIGLCAQDEQSSVDIQVLGPSGLIATSPPHFRPEWCAAAMQAVYPNGARAYVRTPESPGKIRGMEYHLAWLSEVQSWPVATREEAWSNWLLSVRLGYSRTVWDATPKRRHPILKQLVQRAADDPAMHRIVRGSTYENALNLGENYIAELERAYGKGETLTQRGREELEGELLGDSEASLVKTAWIEAARRDRPARFLRKAIGVDPAVTTRAGSDRSGIVLAGLGAGDGQGYVLGDRTGKHDPPTWAALVLDWYITEECDLIVVETNKGGNLLVQNLRAAALSMGGLTIEVVDDKWSPHRRAGVVFVREIYSRGPKEDRAVPLGTAYEAGRISHVRGAKLADLEELITTWEPRPGERSPDGLDALVHVMGEILGLREQARDARKDFTGLAQAASALQQATSTARAGAPVSSAGGLANLAALLGGISGDRV